ncbi:MAG: helix-turn-helix transcriptional regulator [Actinocatenispora sp.]
MPAGQRPLVRRRLRNELRDERERARKSQNDVALAMEWSLSKVIRLEAGQVGISANDMKALLSLYEVSDPERVTFMTGLARAARQQSAWWSRYRDIYPDDHLEFLGYEDEAATIMLFETICIPGLLQTEEYARALMEADPGSQSKVDELIEIRSARQRHVLGRDDPPDLVAVLDEAALRRRVGDADTTAEQLRHIVNVAGMPNVTVQVVPFERGAYVGMSGPFLIFEFSDPNDAPVLQKDGVPWNMLLRDNKPVVDQHRKAFDCIRGAALDPERSLEAIGKIAEECTG